MTRSEATNALAVATVKIGDAFETYLTALNECANLGLVKDTSPEHTFLDGLEQMRSRVHTLIISNALDEILERRNNE